VAAALPLAAVCLLVALSSALGQSRAHISNSRSGQFIVPLVAPPTVNRPLGLEKNPLLKPIDLRLLPVSCERVKELLWRELGAKAPWQGRIFVTLYAASSENDAITISSEWFRDGWQYRLELPDLVQPGRYVRALVQVLLLEMANRNAGTHSGEVPGWLSEGLSREVLASSPVELLLSPPQSTANGLQLVSTNRSQVQDNPLAEAHKHLTAGPALTFQDLSWPTPEQLAGEAGEVYGSSAQLFVSDLLALSGGRDCMRAMLAELPQHYNWQLAFFHAFQAHFPGPREVEKWWALQVVHFTGRELAQNWDGDEGWKKLTEVVRSEVHVRLGTNDMPLRVEAKLQNVLSEWDDARQLPALRTKLLELGLLRPRLSPELASLVDEYCHILNDYLTEREHPGFVLPFRKGVVRRHATETAIKQLDAADEKLAALGPKEKPKTGPNDSTSPPALAKQK
jgi:hypothetical protein